MRSVLRVVVALAALAAGSARAGTILFATEASGNAVDGFCVAADGTLAPTPSVRITTGGPLPRRLLVKADPASGADGVLYVVQEDRVEAFRIGSHGGLTANGSTTVDPNMTPLDVAVSDDGRTVYVPQNGTRRIAAYTLTAEGKLPADHSSCVNFPAGTAPAFQRLRVRNGRLYVSASILGGRISIFPIDADGSLPVKPADPTDVPPRNCRVDVRQEAHSAAVSQNDPTLDLTTCPLAERRKLLTPDSFAISDADILYVESLASRQIIAFTLMDGLFVPPVKKKTGEPIDVCVAEKTNAKTGKIKYQKALGKTAVLQQYHDMALFAPKETIFGSQFTHGRFDAYHIKTNGKLPKQPTRRTPDDARQTPVGIAISADGRTLYVSGGELDRVRAYRLGGKRALPLDPNPFSQTDERKGSFPNAVAVAELSAGCQ
jgi:6-phosphogluconolactonase (cycloisomerase 2 family)